jgi:hypothetical protein
MRSSGPEIGERLLGKCLTMQAQASRLPYFTAPRVSFFPAACLPYLLPFFNVITYGRYLFRA